MNKRLYQQFDGPTPKGMMRVRTAGFCNPLDCFYFQVDSRAQCGDISGGLLAKADQPNSAGGVFNFEDLAALVDAVRAERSKEK